MTLLAPQGLVTPAAILPRVKQFRVTGIFEAGMFEFDSGLALIHMGDAQKLYRMDDRVSGVRLKVDDLFAGYAVSVERLLHLLEPFVRLPHIPGPERGQVDLRGQQLPQELPIAPEPGRQVRAVIGRGDDRRESAVGAPQEPHDHPDDLPV